MKKYVMFYSVIFNMITGCVVSSSIIDDTKRVFSVSKTNIKVNSSLSKESATMYNDYIKYYSDKYRVDAFLIKAIIQIESNYNPVVVSKSNAVGLMQLKADTAGRDVYRLQGKIGQPSVHDLKNANINIDIGAAYLCILQKQLSGIINPITQRYAIIVSYVNGLGALLRVFSMDQYKAVNEINKLSPEQFCRYIQYHHPSKQAYRYLSKINTVYSLVNLN